MTPIKNFQLGQFYQQIFLIEEISYRVYKKDIYTILKLSDVTGKIEAIYWGKLEAKPKSYVNLSGVVEFQNSKKQFKITSYEKVSIPTDTSPYIPTFGNRELDVYQSELESLLTQVEDEEFQLLIKYSLKDINLWSTLRTFSHTKIPIQGGLLIYTTRLVRLVISMYNALHDLELPLNKSLLITGGLFYYIGNMIQGDAHKLFGECSNFMATNHVMISAENDLQKEITESKKISLLNIVKHDTMLLEGEILAKADFLLGLDKESYFINE